MAHAYLCAMPSVIVNMGGEMVYIMQQRLNAQKVPEEKGNKVINDIVRTMFNPRFIDELFRHQTIYTTDAVRKIFDRLAHSSIMRLNESSMDKLFDLMLIVCKYQIMYASPQEVVDVISNHIGAQQGLTEVTSEVAALVDSCASKLHAFYSGFSAMDFCMLRQLLCTMFQDRNLLVTLLKEAEIQNASKFISMPPGGTLPAGALPLGTVRYFKGGVESHREVLPTATSGLWKPGAGERTQLGCNIYQMDVNALSAHRGGPAGRAQDGQTQAQGVPAQDGRPPAQAAREQEEEPAPASDEPAPAADEPKPAPEAPGQEKPKPAPEVGGPGARRCCPKGHDLSPDSDLCKECWLQSQVDGQAAQRAFAAAVKHMSKLPWRRGRLVLVGKGRAGKSSTVRSLMGRPFDANQASTVGLETANVSCTEATNWAEKARGQETAGAMAGLLAQLWMQSVEEESPEDLIVLDSSWMDVWLEDEPLPTSPAPAATAAVAGSEGNGKSAQAGAVSAAPAAQAAQPKAEGAAAAAAGSGLKAVKARREMQKKAAAVAPEEPPAAAPVGVAAPAQVDAGNHPVRARASAVGSGLEVMRARKEMRKHAVTHVEEVAKQLTEEMVSSSGKQLTFSMWDCGGQKVFYNLIHLFFTRCSIYLCTFDMREVLRKDREALETIGFWLHSVRLQARGSPVLLVGTHGDEVNDVASWKKLDGILLNAFRPLIHDSVRPFQGAAGTLWFFPVDNKNRGEAVDKLRSAIEQAALEDEHGYIHQQVPVAWRQVLDQLHLHVAGGNEAMQYATLDEVVMLAKVQNVPEWQVPLMLETFHELGVLLHFSSRPELGKIVILQPQWLVDAICRLVCDFSLHSTDVHTRLTADHAADFYRLQTAGVATTALLDAVWRDYDATEEDHTLRQFFRQIMVEMSLLCPVHNDQWLVPGLLPKQTLASRGDAWRGVSSWVFWVDCSEQFLPPGLFERVVCLCAELSHELGGKDFELGSTCAAMALGEHRFRMQVEGDTAIRVSVLDMLTLPDSDGGPALVLHHIVTLVTQVKALFFRGLDLAIRLSAPPRWVGRKLKRSTAPTMADVEQARSRKDRQTFRPCWSRHTFEMRWFDPWFHDITGHSKLARSQWLRLQEDWPFLRRFTYTNDQKISLNRYLQDPGNWGIGWDALEKLEEEARELKPYSCPRSQKLVPYEDMSMWHIVQLLVKPTCRTEGAPLALVSSNWRPRRVEHFVTHCWSEPFPEFMESLRTVYQTRPQKPSLFICAFALYQGTEDDVGAQLAGKISDAPFVKALRASCQFVVVRNRVEDIYTRAWCLVELLYAKKFGLYSEHVSVTGPNTTLSRTEQTSCLDVRASKEEDRRRILAFLHEETAPEEVDQQIREFREYDAGFCPPSSPEAKKGSLFFGSAPANVQDQRRWHPILPSLFKNSFFTGGRR